MMTRQSDQPAGMVYIMTNAADNNEVGAFIRTPGGTLQPDSLYGTQGSGTGPGQTGRGVDPLSSQGSLVLCPSGRRLFAVNAGSSTISGFMAGMDGQLTLTSIVPSGGMMPVSVTVRGRLLYAANAGGGGLSSNVTGFMADDQARLTMIPRSTRMLSTPGAQPACIAFSPDGSMLAVTELSANRISLYGVQPDGTLSGPFTSVSSGAGPFGAVFTQTGLLLVAEAGANALSSYRMTNGMLQPVSGSVPNGQSATCWVALTPDGHYAFTSNAGSGTITTYGVNFDGTLRMLLNTPVAESMQNPVPIDSGVSMDGRTLYALIGNRGTVSALRIGEGGRLMFLQTAGSADIPTLGTQGLAAR